VTAGAAGVYSAPDFDRSNKIGYLRNGGRTPVEAEPVSKKNCSGGWYKVVSGGYVCGNLGTTNLEHPEVKGATNPPNLDDVLPYPYARNAKNGTPLYKHVPSREQMLRYEPYLEKKDEEKESDKQAVETAVPAPDREVRPASVTTGADAGVPFDPGMADAGIGVAEPSEPAKPWWQQDDIKDRLHEVKLSQLEEDSDDILAKRMVTGFYVAVDRTFRWSGRAWYKTTRGLVMPTDRFWQTPGSKFQGVVLDGEQKKLPMAWVYGGRKSASTYRREGETLTPAASVERFVAIQLTGRYEKIAGNDYAETADGTWIKRAQVRIAEGGPMPQNLTPNERWIDVDLGTQTLVAYEGTRPVYATLISSGKESKIKDKDHRTPTGEWRVREKHVTTTMDGDGSAAGDLPYSIEDVPYVMYFERSYALHGAFWHANYGVQMSHGCVNLAPLDAKHLFFFSDPPLPKGFHGAWASPERPGSRIVVHE
jgi:lipoprotein-anchoring transpeptidase ErfK/SrfK